MKSAGFAAPCHSRRRDAPRPRLPFPGPAGPRLARCVAHAALLSRAYTQPHAPPLPAAGRVWEVFLALRKTGGAGQATLRRQAPPSAATRHRRPLRPRAQRAAVALRPGGQQQKLHYRNSLSRPARRDVRRATAGYGREGQRRPCRAWPGLACFTLSHSAGIQRGNGPSVSLGRQHGPRRPNAS